MHPVAAFVRSIIDFGPYTMFVVVSYAAVFIVSALLIFNAWSDERRQRRALAALEARGIRRRSDATRDAQQETYQS
ncbi:MAG: heme exporter protein CcmD [Alphaproteobacteria bacterium]